MAKTTVGVSPTASFADGTDFLCTEAASNVKVWLVLIIAVPSLLNIFSVVLLILSWLMIRRLKDVVDDIKSTTHWLMRTAVEVGLGPKAKRALMEYARTKPDLQRLVQVPPSKEGHKNSKE